MGPIIPTVFKNNSYQFKQNWQNNLL